MGLIPMVVARTLLAFDVRKLLGLPVPWFEVQDLVREVVVQSRADGFAVVLTGHSLGGGLAQIIGATEGIPTLAFSPVGVGLTSGRVGLYERGDLPVANN